MLKKIYIYFFNELKNIPGIILHFIHAKCTVYFFDLAVKREM